MRAKFALIGIVLLAVVWWAGSYLFSGDEEGGAQVAVPGAAPGARGASGQASGGSGGAGVSAISGAPLDAARLFELGFAGGLVLDRDTRAAIEDLVNALPEDPSPQDLERLERTLREGLPKDEAEKAFKLITGYRSYTREVRGEVQSLGIPTNQAEVKALYDKLDAAKGRHFDDATAAALFGPDERYGRLVMEAGVVQQDPTLTPEQKKQAVEALRAQLPADRRDLIFVPPPEAEASQAGS